eukprot:TRINITY_DN1785_c0_g4_i1.p1 TRINITY_DN1785_c0_g4~~TRINITY_DN1785_c0_g4_i1.p1  ORF type:complete len:528 (-),score=92.33 TRINITY_DN1785_c0_g4_i1:6-1469(-)
MKFHKTVVLDVVGLSKDLISKENTPFIWKWREEKRLETVIIEPAFPAVTCVAQTTYLTGKSPEEHGIVANGFYDKTFCEVKNWSQSSKLVQCKRIFDELKELARENGEQEPTIFTHSFWFTLYDSNIDYLVTPRPQYLQDGGKLPDCYTKPDSLRDSLQSQLGAFPLGKFWGPLTSIESSSWIAKSSILVDKQYDPTLSLIYLPHLDYCLQKYGPNHSIIPQHLQEIDQVVKDLIEYYESTHPDVRIIILSEYGIGSVDKVVHINRHLREAGYLKVRRENGGETLDCGASDAFAVSDHQVAHVYIRDPSKDIENIKNLLKNIDGIENVFTAWEQNRFYKKLSNSRNGAFHSERSGDLIAVCEPSSWFSYYYWQNDNQAPDFAYCVAIHRKPGYDPAEMFFRFGPPLLGKIYLFWKLFLVYALRIRTCVDASPIVCNMIKGSHGIIPKDDSLKPILISSSLPPDHSRSILSEQVYQVIKYAVLHLNKE